ncbi:MAG: hypothetical protein HY909_26695 [Deltaproteobacteria bacterium]|nr:hypothetical protein [Deltaproteobacteria bacterium]
MKGALGARCVLAALLPGACAAPTVSLREGARTYTAERYETVLERWTRVGHAYTFQGLEDQIAVTATFESWDFRWAYVVRYASDFRLSPSARTQLLDTSLREARRENVFYVALYTQSRRWGELTRPTSAWRVLLVDDHENAIAPIAVDPLARPGALERTYFPYTTVWRQVYRVRFPRRVSVPGRGEVEFLGDQVRFFLLRFAGPLGHTDLRWSVEG